MPLEYAGGGVLKEHAAVREAVGVFDVSHLGKATRARRRRGRLRQRLPDQRPRPDRRRARPSTRCAATQSGGVVDDLIAYLHADDHVFLIPNAANTAEVVRRLQRRRAGRDHGHRRARGVRACWPCRGRARPSVLAALACRPSTST